MTIMIKICGLRNTQAIEAAIAGGASHLGFIFFEKSPRHVMDMSLARDLSSCVDRRAKIVPVTVNATDAYLDDIVMAMAPDILQLHGRETPDRVQEVRARYDTPIMKAISIRDISDIKKIDSYHAAADHLLLDAKPLPGATLPGGNGNTFDWSLLKHVPSDISYFLSGGLNLDNIESALKQVHPYGIDLSSGVESQPGVKDVKLIAEFLSRVAQIEAL